jgi:hypothetical protein
MANLYEIQDKLVDEFKKDVKPYLERKYKMEIKYVPTARSVLFYSDQPNLRGRYSKILSITEAGRIVIYDDMPDVCSESKIMSLQKKSQKMLVERIDFHLRKIILKEFTEIKKDSSVEVGDIFYDSWGYDQTNVDFYKVVKKVSPQVVLVRQVANKVTSSGKGSDYVVPDEKFISEPVKCRLVKGYNVPALSLSGFDFAGHKAIKWDGKPQYQTASGWGH